MSHRIPTSHLRSKILWMGKFAAVLDDSNVDEAVVGEAAGLARQPSDKVIGQTTGGVKTSNIFR